MQGIEKRNGMATVDTGQMDGDSFNLAHCKGNPPSRGKRIRNTNERTMERFFISPLSFLSCGIKIIQFLIYSCEWMKLLLGFNFTLKAEIIDLAIIRRSHSIMKGIILIFFYSSQQLFMPSWLPKRLPIRVLSYRLNW